MHDLYMRAKLRIIPRIAKLYLQIYLKIRLTPHDSHLGTLISNI